MPHPGATPLPPVHLSPFLFPKPQIEAGDDDFGAAGWAECVQGRRQRSSLLQPGARPPEEPAEVGGAALLRCSGQATPPRLGRRRAAASLRPCRSRAARGARPCPHGWAGAELRGRAHRRRDGQGGTTCRGTKTTVIASQSKIVSHSCTGGGEEMPHATELPILPPMKEGGGWT